MTRRRLRPRRVEALSPGEEWWPAAEVCARLHVTPRTLWNWRRRGVLAGVFISGRWYHPASAVRALWRGRLGVVEDQWDEQIE
jgi:hypothetical protein